MLEKLLILLLSLASCVFAESGFLMTVPKVLHPGQNERICLTFFDVSEDVEVDVTVKTKPPTVQSYSFPNGMGECVDLYIPPSSKSEAVIEVSGEAGDYHFNDTTEVSLVTPGSITFIQTDKPQYKPGQTVKCRVLSLDANLIPITKPIHAIWIEDPSGVRMAQWMDAITDKGLVGIEFRTSDEPVQGTWSVMVQLDNEGKAERKTFKIEEYVLPKYEITIKPPSWVPITAEEISGEVCAKYTYGKPVRGQVSLKICITQTYQHKKRPCYEMEAEPINGCYKFTAPTSAMGLKLSRYSIWGAKLMIEASVTEDGTGVVLDAKDESANVERYLLKFDFKPYTPDHFKPSLPCSGKLVVTNGDGSRKSNQIVRLKSSVFDKNYTSDSNGEIHFTFDTDTLPIDSQFSISAMVPDDEVYTYSREYYTPNRPRGYHTVKPWYSPSGSYMQMGDPGSTAALCDTQLEIPVTYTTEATSEFTFHYQVISKGNIVKTGQLNYAFAASEDDVARVESQNKESTNETGKPLPYRANFMLFLPIDHQMSPLARVVLYYIREDREVVSDSIEINVDKCLKNKVSLKFMPEEVRPGADTTMHLHAAPDSLCSVGVVDKSVHVLGGNNQVNKAKVFEILSTYDVNEHSGPYERDEYCQKFLEELDQEPPIFDRMPPPPRGPERLGGREKRSVMPWWGGSAYSEQYDAIKAFKATGMNVLSDLTLETRICQEEEYYGIYYDSVMEGAPGPVAMPEFDDGGESAAEEKSEQDSDETVDIRTYFPETWLWELYNIGEEAHLELSKEAPHTITDWIGSAFCTNQQTGFGVSDTITLHAFQPFFLSFTLPYSSVRGETLRTPVSVFNYLDKCIVVSISMESTNEVSVVDPSRKVCVCGSDTVTEYFMVTARKVGMVNLTATAVSVSNEDWRCENNLVEAIEPVRDAATRQLLIEPEGKREEYTISNFVCPSSGKRVEGSFELDLPDVGLVPDSAAAMVSVIGDVMGPTLSNLDQLVRMPMGCGEQNMILFAPNIYVVQYLEASNQMSSEIRSDAIQHMETGYQRELTYRHSDGSYSAFGESDESGSTWLTAFVVRCFAQARDYIFIDENDLTASIEWFRSIQKENGCFRQVGRVLHKDMKGGLGGSDGGAGLTAYVLVALIDAGIPSDDSMIQEGLGCLAISTDTDVYTAALITYVYSKLGDDYEDIQASMKEKMEEMATKEDGMKHWSKNRDEPPIDPEDFLHSHHRAGQSADVEMTSYALMAYLHMGGGDVEAIADGLAMVRWLSSQRNAQGGFHSTQDTVVALQALASYAQLVYSDDVSLRVVFSDTESTGSLRRSIHITSENSLLLHQHDVPVPNSITYRVSGTGCALLQANVRYHSDPSARRAKVQPFDVNVQVHHTRDIKKSHCAFRKLNICVRSRSQEPSNMAVVAVKMQTGWIPDKMSLKQMRKDGVKNLQRQEVDHNMVNLYFDELDEEKICLEFLVEEDMRVTDPKQAHVHVYDYYDTELSHVVNYFIRTTCGTKEELSELTPEEYGDLINGGFEGQIRQPVDFPFKDEEKLKCPLCYNEVPANFAQLLCDSLHAYKVVVKHNKIRLLADKKEKHPLNKITYIKEDSLGFSVEECRCPVLIDDLSVKPNKNSRLLVLTKSSLGEDDSGRQTRYSLDLSTHTTIVPLPRDTERAIQSSMQSCDV